MADLMLRYARATWMIEQSSPGWAGPLQRLRPSSLYDDARL